MTYKLNSNTQPTNSSTSSSSSSLKALSCLTRSIMEGGSSYEEATELRLGLPGTVVSEQTGPRGTKRTFVETEEPCRLSNGPSGEAGSVGSSLEEEPPAKAQVVGWPPIRSYRRNNFQVRKVETESEVSGIYVKVSMDGAPYLRKIDLKMYKGYEELREALAGMFKCFTLGEYAVTYEDKDGDWMLVGDVPWEMFISSCNRLRIMRGSEARGLDSN